MILIRFCNYLIKVKKQRSVYSFDFQTYYVKKILLHIHIYTNRNPVVQWRHFRFPPGWVVMFLDSHRTVFTFLSWLDLLGVALAFWISILKIFKLLPNYWHCATDITSFEKHLESSSGHTLSSHFGEISFQEYVSEGIFHPVFYGDLVYKLRRVKCEANFVLSSSKIVKRLQRRKYDQVNREDDRPCAWPFYSLVQIFPKALHYDY